MFVRLKQYRYLPTACQRRQNDDDDRRTPDQLPPPHHPRIIHQSAPSARSTVPRGTTHISTFSPSNLPTTPSNCSLFVISASTSTTLTSSFAASHFALTSARLLARRARRTRLHPALAKRRAVEAPIPAEAPVIRAGNVSGLEDGGMGGRTGLADEPMKG